LRSHWPLRELLFSGHCNKNNVLDEFLTFLDIQSQVTRGGGFIFLAGQVPTDSAAKPVGNNTTEKARRMCQNAQLMLETAGSSLDKVLRITVSKSSSVHLFSSTINGYCI